MTSTSVATNGADDAAGVAAGVVQTVAEVVREVGADRVDLVTQAIRDDRTQSAWIGALLEY